MGGSLASEATLLLSRVTFSHNIIGMLGLDVPFLGVHPHVVASGVAGLAKKNKPREVLPMERPTAGTDKKTASQMSLPDSVSLLSLTNTESTSETSTSPNASRTSLELYPPPPSRTPSPRPEQKKSNFKDTITKTAKAIYKNRHDLGGAGPRYLWSHLEYGHILLDPAELKAQYDQLRLTKIHFANYYTSVARKKKSDEAEEKQGRVFCSLPSSAARDMDGWISVEMPEEMDEPTAHSAIFVKEWFPGYWKMVEDMAVTVESWTRRTYT